MTPQQISLIEELIQLYIQMDRHARHPEPDWKEIDYLRREIDRVTEKLVE